MAAKDKERHESEKKNEVNQPGATMSEQENKDIENEDKETDVSENEGGHQEGTNCEEDDEENGGACEDNEPSENGARFCVDKPAPTKVTHCPSPGEVIL